MTDDHRALIEQARAEHVSCADQDQCREPLCVMCADDWPCLTARLAEGMSTLLDMKDQRDIVVPDLAAGLEAPRATGGPVDRA